ncbi:hypothetical protein EJA72_16020 [Pseudomonas sp. PB120]|uniref:hypothetical protein n=1 Tax=Pseudomonas sp. PB120 TaxID=2494700 RepID=UPI0012FD4D27|nr:hypothetical protein [Pseudomonas sp. PB120]MVV49731.1 hypothetical protein [Pseudomonas sp. PB120]
MTGIQRQKPAKSRVSISKKITTWSFTTIRGHGMRKSTFSPENMPTLELDTSSTSRYEASQYLDSPEIAAAYVAESKKHGEEALANALREIAKARARTKSPGSGLNRANLKNQPSKRI